MIQLQEHKRNAAGMHQCVYEMRQNMPQTDKYMNFTSYTFSACVIVLRVFLRKKINKVANKGHEPERYSVHLFY